VKLRGADILARTLAAAGTRHVFTLSGNHVMPVFDAALDAKLSLIHVRHEAAAVHMADAWGRLTGEAGIALVTGGPGHANAVGALYTALAAQSPLVLISGHAPLGELGRGAFQEMRQADIAAPLCKASWTAQSAEGLGADVQRALRVARSGIPGPVHLSVPNDVLDATVEADLPESFGIEEAGKSVVDFSSAKRPLIIAGPAAMRARNRYPVPIVGMESPRGVNDPSLGKLAAVLRRADAVLLVGKPKDFTLKFGQAFAPDCRVLEAGLDVEIRASSQETSWAEEVSQAVAWRPTDWKTVMSRPEGPVHPVELCREVQGLLGEDSVLVCDGGEFGQWAQACLRAPHRIINGPAGSIGSALPFAAAAKLARPKANVVAMLGDGTLGFHLSELDTALRYGLAYTAVIGNDACWNAEYQIQLREYGKDRAHGLDLLPTRYGAVASALGCHGEDVVNPRELEGALARASRSGKPACVNVMIERLPAPKY
jgi:acetolactate synthase-1/2/3 large subunit